MTNDEKFTTPEMEKLVFNLRHKPPVGESITSEHLAQAANVIESLIKERDDLLEDRDGLRRLICFTEVFDPHFPNADTDYYERKQAELRGWDCFKEDSDAEESH